MKAALIVALLAFPAIAAETEDPALVALTAVYTTCTRNYIGPRINWDVSPGDLADAAAGMCSKERLAVSESITRNLHDVGITMQTMALFADEHRFALITAIVELRNNLKS